jgi:ribose 5-phosphate isomerase B
MIFLAADHAGFAWKKRLAKWLVQHKFAFVDAGAITFQSGDDYPAIARRAALLVKKNRAQGIFICGSGVGMSIVANRISRIRAVNAQTRAVARRSRSEDDANVLVLGSRVLSFPKALAIVRLWLAVPSPVERRHLSRIRMIDRSKK